MKSSAERWISSCFHSPNFIDGYFCADTAVGIKVEFKRVKTGFVVSFHRPRWEEGEGLGKDGQKSKVKSKVKVIEIIGQNPSATIPEIAASLGMSIPGIEKIIRSLKEEKRLRRVGPDKGGHWEVHD